MIGWISKSWNSMWYAGLRPRSLVALLFVIVCVGIATAVRIGFGFISPESAVFAPYYSATLVAALVGGAESGTVAACSGGIAAYCLFVPSDWAMASFRLEQLISLILYSTSSVIIIWAADSYRVLLRRLRSEEVARQLLNDELVHRIKNILASVQYIIGQSLRGNEDVLETVRARLAAFAATNDILVKSQWRNAPLRDTLVREFAPFDPARFELHGNDIDCPYDIAILLGLIVHELTMNAVKYGSLSTSSGRVRVSWTIVGERLSVEWIESGGPQPKPPTRAGFGSQLLRSGVRQFEGSVDWQLETAGLQCRFSLTMPQRPKRGADEVMRRHVPTYGDNDRD